MENKIERSIELKAPINIVWDALTDSKKFGEWFGVKVEKPFIPGQTALGPLTIPGFEHIKWEVVVQKMEPENLFSYTWHPYAIDSTKDYSSETPTFIEFKLKKTSLGTLLTLAESGFDKIPEHRRSEAFKMHKDGWTEQMKNIEKYLSEVKTNA